MKTLGIRVKPREVIIAIYDSEACVLENVENIKIPRALPEPESLKYVRSSILDVLRDYNIDHASLRVVEGNSKTLSIGRIEIEGVIKEAFASSTLKSYFCGRIASLSSRIGIPSTDFKLYVDGDKNYDSVENWHALTKEQREAVFSALGAVNV